MGAWAKDPVPGAAAGARPERRSNIAPGTRNSAPGHQNRPRGFRIVYHILEYYIIILYI